MISTQASSSETVSLSVSEGAQPIVSETKIAARAALSPREERPRKKG